MKLTLYGNPATKKNSQSIIINRATGRPMLIQSKRYREYENACIQQITGLHRKKIDYPVTVICRYFRKTKHRVDLTNLLEATDDILVKAGVLADDNSQIIKSHDGSRVFFDKDNPRVEIEIVEYT
ncbi:MAG: RusA family crossover junction endodeoxyribonuclease [Prevotellaceae bacterium]|nr:RusA family crossover junction endodeoxyribonuclease [Prevotellaceae bacterium]